MIEEVIDDKELTFLKELEKYENKWVAIYQSGDDEMIVGSGNNATEAMSEAESKGFMDAVLLRLHRFDRGYIPVTIG